MLFQATLTAPCLFLISQLQLAFPAIIFHIQVCLPAPPAPKLFSIMPLQSLLSFLASTAAFCPSFSPSRFVLTHLVYCRSEGNHHCDYSLDTTMPTDGSNWQEPKSDVGTWVGVFQPLKSHRVQESSGSMSTYRAIICPWPAHQASMLPGPWRGRLRGMD